MEATSVTFGTVNAPGYRYHPTVVAQAAATLGVLYPERFWLSVGSGELLNEHVTGEKWPGKEERNARLEECAGIIRGLWDGETVTEEQVERNVRVSADLDRHVEWLDEDRLLDVEKIFLHNVNREQEQFVEAFGEHVLPALESWSLRESGRPGVSDSLNLDTPSYRNPRTDP